MKIFIKVAPATESVNFVDEKNCVLGWCAEQICCENHNCLLSSTEPEGPSGTRKRVKVENIVLNPRKLDGTTIDLPNWEIDADYYKEIGSAVVFRLATTAEYNLGQAYSEPEYLYITLENYHNGYYSHGFKLDVGGITKRKGSI